MNRPAKLILTCEHGGNEVPYEFRFALDSPVARQHLNSHRGWDPGALEAASYFAEQSGAPLIHATTTRLLIDLNRSIGNAQLFSQFTRSAPPDARQAIMERHYHPYRKRVEQTLKATVESGFTVVHLSIHTFTPVFRGIRRQLDIGLLFDPARHLERNLCGRWQRDLHAHEPRLRVEPNQPYFGTDDGLTTAMRIQFADEQYAGIELEINNQVMRRTPQGRRRLWRTLFDSFRQALQTSSLSES